LGLAAGSSAAWLSVGSVIPSRTRTKVMCHRVEGIVVFIIG
jgi:hypothetical protein